MEIRNIYQIARESAGLTQERAAELLDISPESVRAYEGSRRVPPDAVVIRMIEVYGVPHLAYQHLKLNTQLASRYLPPVAITSLPQAVLRVQKEVADFLRCREELIDMASDGVIDAQERPRFDAIMQELEDIVSAFYQLKFCRKVDEKDA